MRIWCRGWWLPGEATTLGPAVDDTATGPRPPALRLSRSHPYVNPVRVEAAVGDGEWGVQTTPGRSVGYIVIGLVAHVDETRGGRLMLANSVPGSH
jgi:hypothetical protein